MSLDAPFEGPDHLEPARPKAWTVPPAGPSGPPSRWKTAGDLPSPVVPLDKVIVGDRIRKDMGDLDGLAASIKSEGLLNPLTVDGNFKLLAGQRRLEALRLLGIDRVEVRVAVSVHDALAAARVERDENTQRKDFTPEEAVRAGSLIEELERPKAEERKAASRPKPGQRVGAEKLPAPTQPPSPQVGGGKLPPPTGEGTQRPVAARLAPKPKTRDAAAAAVGMKPRTYEKAKAVVKAAEDPALPPAVRSEAAVALEEMNRTGKVDPAFQRVQRAAQPPKVKDWPEVKEAERLSRPMRLMRKALKDMPTNDDLIRGLDADGCEGVDLLADSLTRWVNDWKRDRKAATGLRIVKGSR